MQGNDMPEWLIFLIGMVVFLVILSAILDKTEDFRRSKTSGDRDERVD
jgi:hypothetical protein